MIPCEDCGTPWESTAAANECAILDAIETRNARHTTTRDNRPDKPRYELGYD